MTPELTAVFDPLYHDVKVAHSQWIMYKQLLDATATLRETVPQFADAVSHALADAVIMAISRLTDDAVREDANSLSALTPVFETPPDGELVAAIKQAETAAYPIRQHRNKRIGHIDRKVRLGTATLNQLTVEQIDDALAQIAEVLNVIPRRTNEAQSNFAETIIGHDIEHVVRILAKYRQDREARVAWLREQAAKLPQPSE